MNYPLFIADIGSNHNQDGNRTKTLIQTAKAIGCYGVKFQLFDPDRLIAPKFPDKREALRQRQLPLDFISPIAKFCKEIDIKFVCTPFHPEAVDLLINNGPPDYLKIGSYEFGYEDLINKVANSNIPWILSVGMTERYQIIDMLNGINYNDYPDYILHCCSKYPTKPKDSNLMKIPNIKSDLTRNLYDIKIGWSDHTVEPGVIHKAIAMGAQMIEFHLDLDGNGFEFEHGHCWLPEQIGKVIKDVRIGQEAIWGNPDYTEEKKWQTDPSDGMRPLKEWRELE